LNVETNSCFVSRFICDEQNLIIQGVALSNNSTQGQITMLLNHTARVLVAAATPAEFGDLFADLAGNAVIASDRLVRDDVFTSAVAYQFDLPFHSLNKGSEKLTRLIPGVDPRLLEKLDNRGIVRLGSKLERGDVLIGKTCPLYKSGLSPSEQGFITELGLTDLSTRDDSLYYDLLDPGIVCAVQLFALWRYECGRCGAVGHSGVMGICPYCAGPLDNLHKDNLSEGEVIRVKVDVLVRRELRVSDVLNDGHGNQFVVARIVPEATMPLIKEASVGLCIHAESCLAAQLKEEGTLRYPSTRGNGETERSVRFGWTKLKKISVQMEQKLTARGRGPHSLISQFPLASGAGNIPQRLTRKASRALFREGYRNNLLELLTVKSDALDARDKFEEALAGGQPFEITVPETSSRLERILNCLGLTFVLLSGGVNKTLLDGVSLHNEVDAFQFLGATAQDIRSWSFGEVKKPETINYRTYRPEKDGLFCERIFGPEKDLECACGKYSGVKYKGMICDRCGVKVTDSRVRRKRMGHIELASPVVHCWFSHSESKPSKLSCLLGISQLQLEQIIDHKSFVVTNPGTSPLNTGQILNQEENDDAVARFSTSGVELDTGAQAVRWLLRTKNLHQLQWIVLDAIAVLPPDLRPLVLLDSGNFATSDLNDLYRWVVNRSNRLKKLVEIGAPEVIIRNEKRELQKAVDALFANCRTQDPVTDDNGRPLVCLTKHFIDLLKQLEKKPVDYSGRAVVIPNTGLQPGILGLPELMVRRLFRAAVLRCLIDAGHSGSIREAQKLLEKSPQPPELIMALENALVGRSVLVLTEDGKPAVFRPVLVSGEAIQLHPVTASDLGLNFAGEQLVLHVPLSDIANQELGKPQQQAEPSSDLVFLNAEKLVQMTLEPEPTPLTQYDRILLGINQLHSMLVVMR
jgi:hypothetical protein